MPRFSVIIPVYNRGEFIRKAIDSVLEQTNSDFELIVIDDGSTDDTLKVIESYGNRIKFLKQANQGPEVARNAGAAVAVGEYLAFLDSDDLMLPWALKTYERVIVSEGLPSVIFSNLKFFSEANAIVIEELRSDEIKILRYKNFLSKDRTFRTSASIIVVKRALFGEVNGFRNSSSTSYYYDDLDFILRVCVATPAILITTPPVIAYRMHQNNIVHNIDFNFRGIKAIIDAEKHDAYPGGPSLRFKRYAFIGGPAYFSCKKTLLRGYPLLSLRILFSSFFMIIAGIIHKLWLKMYGVQNPIVLE